MTGYFGVLISAVLVKSNYSASKTNTQNPCSKIFLWRRTVARKYRPPPNTFGTRIFITAFKRASRWSLSTKYAQLVRWELVLNIREYAHKFIVEKANSEQTKLTYAVS
jgi:hypothetical protein